MYMHVYIHMYFCVHGFIYTDSCTCLNVYIDMAYIHTHIFIDDVNPLLSKMVMISGH